MLSLILSVGIILPNGEFRQNIKPCLYAYCAESREQAKDLNQMKKEVVYKGSVLMKGSRALELWEEWQRAKDRNVAQKKLDQHMKDVERRYQELMK